MEAYPPDYVQHNLPLVLVSGFGELDNDGSPPGRQEYGARISTQSPECLSDQAKRLLQGLRALDGTGCAWNSTALPGSTGSVRYQIKTVGRSYTLPARKAAPLPKVPGSESPPVARNAELHSPLSPLSPGSPVFPDGVFTPLWLHKHQHQVPCLFVAVFQIRANEASQDERLRGDINAIKHALTRSMFKTRLAVILISDRSILDAPDLEDRIAVIRRAAGLDSKTGLFFMPPMSAEAEIAIFVQDMMRLLQPSCIEYYRDLTKRARRKKARGGPPPLSGTPVGGASQATTQSGWNVRYEVKQGVFAEFRQEMDVAERHFSAALEELFTTEGGVFETTSNWSPRWDEVRLLSDATALRILRCQLWNGQTTRAVQSWVNYKSRVRDLLDRRGKGSATYCWNAWESRWANIMSQLVQLADITPLRKSHDTGSDPPVVQVYAQPEKGAAIGERLPAWYSLHHSGYWLRLFAKGIRARWEKALAIPEEDRVPPGQSPASSVANRWQTYDSYLVPDPHQEAPLSGEGAYDHVTELGRACIRAAEEFEARQQARMSEQIKLELAEDLIDAGRRSDALQLLTVLWEESTWRADDWHIPFGRLLLMLLGCVRYDQSPQLSSTIPAVVWELLAIAHIDAPDTTLDLSNCLHDRQGEEPISLTFTDKTRLCPFTTHFAFGTLSSYVGEAQECQLTLKLNAPPTTKPLQLSSVAVKLGNKQVIIRHDGAESDVAIAMPLQSLQSMRELDDGSLESSADLRFRPQTAKTLEFAVMLREARVCDVDDVVIHVETSKFALRHRLSQESILPTNRWRIAKDGVMDTFLLPHMDSRFMAILPKPPKVQIALQDPRIQYFTDEHIRLSIKLYNGEAEAVTGAITPRIESTDDDQALDLKWAGDEPPFDITKTVSNLAASAIVMIELFVYAPPEATTVTLALDMQYTLASDPGTTLTKTTSIDLKIVPAFEAKFTFAPRLHLDPWPSYFSAPSTTEDVLDGVKQLWHLGAQLSSRTDQEILVRKVELAVHEVLGGALCTIGNAIQEKEEEEEALSLGPGEKNMSDFQLTTQKFSIDDRRPTHLDLSLIVTWSTTTGSAAEEAAETIIAAPRLTIPTTEPRVLCTISQREKTKNEEYHILQYHLENPSTHFLTFAVTMEASNEFGFSGHKYRTMSLAPLSRHHVEYRLLLHEEVEEGRWIKPNLQVVDSYYNKNLRVNPGGQGVQLGKEGEIMVWAGGVPSREEGRT